MADPAPAWRDALRRIAQTPDGKLLIEELQRDRVHAYRALATSEGIQMARCQGGFNFLQKLFGHNNIDDPTIK